MIILKYHGVIAKKTNMTLDVEPMDWFYNDTTYMTSEVDIAIFHVCLSKILQRYHNIKIKAYFKYGEKESNLPYYGKLLKRYSISWIQTNKGIWREE